MSSVFTTESKGYGALWDECRVKDVRAASAKSIAEAIIKDWPRYQKVADETKVPKEMIAVLHLRESDRSFRTHLHNGDPLTARTYHVPAGRPLTGAPPFTWEESAIDALTMQGLNKVSTWSVERMLYECERYNGRGYVTRGENSPYVWSWTTEQEEGKFASDGHFDPSLWDTQPGCAAIFKELIDLDDSSKRRFQIRQSKMPADAKATQVVNHKKVIGGVAGGGVVGAAGTEATKQTTTTGVGVSPLLYNVFEYTLIGVVVITIAVTTALIARRFQALDLKWSGIKL